MPLVAADALHDAVIRALTALDSTHGDAPVRSGTLHRVIRLAAARLSRIVRSTDEIVAPPSMLLTDVCAVLQRPEASAPDAPLVVAAINVLCAAMRRRTALRTPPGLAVVLRVLRNEDAALLLLLARQYPTPLLMRCEVRHESLRYRASTPGLVRLVSDDERWSPDGLPLTRGRTATLERLGLVTWTNGTITPAESPIYLRARRDARMGRTSLREGLLRWLSGRHMAPAPDDDETAAQAGVGGIELTYRVLHLTRAARALVPAVREPVRSIDRWRKAIHQRSLEQLHTIR